MRAAVRAKLARARPAKVTRPTRGPDPSLAHRGRRPANPAHQQQKRRNRASKEAHRGGTGPEPVPASSTPQQQKRRHRAVEQANKGGRFQTGTPGTSKPGTTVAKNRARMLRRRRVQTQ